MNNKFFKSTNIIVTDENGILSLSNNNSQIKLSGNFRDNWRNWNSDFIFNNTNNSIINDLIQYGFVKTLKPNKKTNYCNLDHIVPTIKSKFVKWYYESDDLVVLFNSSPMKQENPLIILNPYGSFCWKCIENGFNINKIREEGLRIFNIDQVVNFLLRMIYLGFISHLAFDITIHDQIPCEFELDSSFIQFYIHRTKIPWYCLWEICTICDLRCKSCYINDFTNNIQNKFHLDYIINELVDTGIFYVTILGGEPLINDNLEYIIQSLRNKGIFVKIISNGQKLDFNRALSLKQSGLNKIEISFDGLNQISHDNSRGQGTFDKAIQAIKNGKKAEIDHIGIVLTLFEENIVDFNTLPKFLISNELNYCYISIFKKTGIQATRFDFNPLTNDHLIMVKMEIEIWKSIYPKLTFVLLPNCTCGKSSIVLNYKGNMRMCPFSNKTIGNIFENNFLELWKLSASFIDVSEFRFCKLS